VLRFRFSSSFLSSDVSFLRYQSLQGLWTHVYVISGLSCRCFCLDHVRYWLLHCNISYMYKFLLVYSFVFHLICHCCLLTLTVLCFSVCCLFRCLLCCCFLCGSSAIGTKYPLTLSFSFYNHTLPNQAFFLLLFPLALYASVDICLWHSIKVTKYTCC